MLPRRFSIIVGNTCLEHKYGPRTLTSMSWSHRTGSISKMDSPNTMAPALLNSTSYGRTALPLGEPCPVLVPGR